MNFDNISLAQLYELRLALNNHITEIESQALESLKAGKPVSGYELKTTVTTKRKVNESLLIEKVSELGADPEDFYEKKLIGLGKLDKLLKEEFDSELIFHITELCIEHDEVIGQKLVFVGE